MKKIIFTLLLLTLLPSIYAADSVKFISNQSEYFFLVNEEASISFETENIEDPVTGLMTYTVQQLIQQQGASYTSSNTQTKTITLRDEPMLINFGTSPQPATLDISLKFDYTEDDKDIFVTLPEIKVHFVEEEDQKQNKQDKQESTSQTQQQKQEQQQQEKSEKQKQLEEQMKQQEKQKELQNKLQNNQVPQDTQALKQRSEERRVGKECRSRWSPYH